MCAPPTLTGDPNDLIDLSAQEEESLGRRARRHPRCLRDLLQHGDARTRWNRYSDVHPADRRGDGRPDHFTTLAAAWETLIGADLLSLPKKYKVSGRLSLRSAAPGLSTEYMSLALLPCSSQASPEEEAHCHVRLKRRCEPDCRAQVALQRDEKKGDQVRLDWSERAPRWRAGLKAGKTEHVSAEEDQSAGV
jgi:hypothetical protein